MADFIISVPLDTKLAEFIGKKGSVNSVTFYNRKIDNDTIVALTPSSIEEKFYALATSLLIADQIVISTASVDKYLGEALVAASLLNKHVIITNDNDISNLMSSIRIQDTEVVDKAMLLERITKHSKKDTSQLPLVVDIDKAFPVKGVGTVLLGIVRTGTIKVHDKMHHPNGKEVLIRSIQSQDVDVQTAGRGTRVGLAIKGVEYEEFDKGDVLSEKAVKRVQKLAGSVSVSAISNEEIREGARYGIAINMSYVEGTIEEASEGSLKIRLEKQVCAEIGDEFLLVRPRSPRIFASGKVTSVS